MEITLAGRITARQYPWLHRLLSRSDLRSFHGRELFSAVVMKAMSLSADDKREYGALLLSDHTPVDGNGQKRFKITLDSQEHPEATEALKANGLHAGNNPRLLHLIEVAAGLMFNGGRTLAPSPVAHAGPVDRAPIESHAEPASAKKKKANAPSPASSTAQGVIVSTATRADLAEVDLGDLNDLFGGGE